MSDRTPKQCEGCAFLCGAAAYREPHNFIKAKLAALGGFPFYCHAGQDWRDPESHKVATRREVRERGIRVCAGWKAEVGRLARLGYYGRGVARMFVLAFALVGLDELSIFLHSKDKEEKAESLAKLQNILKRLNARARRAKKGTLKDG